MCGTLTMKVYVIEINNPFTYVICASVCKCEIYQFTLFFFFLSLFLSFSFDVFFTVCVEMNYTTSQFDHLPGVIWLEVTVKRQMGFSVSCLYSILICYVQHR